MGLRVHTELNDEVQMTIPCGSNITDEMSPAKSDDQKDYSTPKINQSDSNALNFTG